MRRRSPQAQAQRSGKLAERLAEITLNQVGYKLVEKVEAPRTRSGIYLKTCSGDFRAVQPGGKSVLVECKYRDRNLRRSDFQDHQIMSLQEHHAAGGISLVAHVTRDGCRLIGWAEVCTMFFLVEAVEGKI